MAGPGNEATGSDAALHDATSTSVWPALLSAQYTFIDQNHSRLRSPYWVRCSKPTIASHSPGRAAPGPLKWQLSPDYQDIRNPGYNHDRGPVHFGAVRFHAEYSTGRTPLYI